jgi:tRNA(fMet)-specific endonuclease VapC
LILDTNALSAFADGDEEIAKTLAVQRSVAIPVIVLGEFRYGIAGSRHRKAYENWLESELRNFEILYITEETAVAYAALRVELKRIGRPIPANDAWIAALSIQHQRPVLTRDEHFDALPRIARVTW